MKTPLRSPLLLVLVLISTMAVVVPGCKKKTAAKGAVGAGSAEAQASTTLATLKVPKEVVAFGGADNVQLVLEGTAAAAKDLHPMAANIAVMAQAMLQQGLGLQSPAGINLAKPVRFALVDPKKNETGPVVLALTMTSKKDFVASLCANKKEKDQGNAYSCVPMGGKPTFFNFLGDFVVVTHQPGLFAKQKATMETLVTTKGTKALRVVVEASNLHALYQQEMNAVMTEMEKGMVESPSATAMAKQGLSAFKGMSGWGKELAAETDRVILTYEAGQEGLKLAMGIKPKAGSGFETSAKAFEAKAAPALLDALPAGTPFFMAGKFDPKKSANLMTRMISFSMSFLPEGMGKEFAAASQKFWQATNGEFVTGLYTEPEGGMALIGLYGVTDEDKAREAMKSMMGMYKDPGYIEMMKKMKMEVEYKQDAYKVGDVSVSTTTTKMAGLDRKAAFSEIIGSLTNSHMALDKKRGVYAIGPSAKAAMEAFLGGKVKGGLASDPGVKRALSSAAPGSSLWVYGAMAGLAKEIFKKMGADPSKITLPEAKEGACLSFGAQDGQVNGAINLPVGQLKVIAAAIKQVGGVMGR